MKALPPLDSHAHVSPDIAAADLEKLGAVVLIATRSIDDFELVKDRRDQVSVWGLGCHPSLVKVQNAFDVERFEGALQRAAFVAEVGLDGDSRVPMERQKETFGAILNALVRTPRIASVHSYKATEEVLAMLGSEPRRAGAVLHWWLGNDEQTRRAIDMGCRFSVNFSMIRLTDGWRNVPLDRILVETDHPHGDRFSAPPKQPGRVQRVEAALAAHHGLREAELRALIWQNFLGLIEATETASLFPAAVQRMLVAAAG